MYLPPPGAWWRLDVPSDTIRLLPFISDALDAIGSWKDCTAWPRNRKWPDFGEMADPAASLCSFLLGGAGVHLGFDGAIAFDGSERNRLIAVAAAPILFGRTVCEDILLFPDHGEFFLQCDHHHDVTVSVRDASLMEPFDRYMRDRGHEVTEG